MFWPANKKAQFSKIMWWLLLLVLGFFIVYAIIKAKDIMQSFS